MKFRCFSIWSEGTLFKTKLHLLFQHYVYEKLYPSIIRYLFPSNIINLILEPDTAFCTCDTSKGVYITSILSLSSFDGCKGNIVGKRQKIT